MITLNGIIGSGGVILIREQVIESYKLGLKFLFWFIGVQRRLTVEKISCCRWRKGIAVIMKQFTAVLTIPLKE